MYLEGSKPQHVYRLENKKNTRVKIVIHLLIIGIFSIFIGTKAVELFNSSTSTHYIVQAEQGSSEQLSDVQIAQDREYKLFYDEEFYRTEQLNILDKRTYVLEKYFQANNSPLVGHAQEFIDACDQFGAPKDCVVVAAIAKNESNLCKYYMSAEMKNCWGYGGPGVHRWTFPSFKAGIEQVTNILVNRYGLEYMVDPRKMQRTFCGADPSCETWGGNIIKIMDQIDAFAESLGVGKLRS